NDELKALLAFNLGRSLLLNQEPDQAKVYLDRAKEYFLQTGNRSRLIAILGTQASIALIKGNQDAALALFEEAYTIAREIGDSLGEAASACGIGQILAERGSSEAHDKLLRALELYRSLGHRLDEFKCLVLLAQIATASANDTEVVRLLSQA